MNTRSYTLGLYEKSMPNDLSWRDKLIASKEAGYDFVEISIDETDAKLSRLDMSLKEREELVKLMSDVGIPIRTMCLSGHRKYPLGSTNPKTVDRGMEIMEKAIQLADDLGIRIIQLAGYDVYYEEGSEKTRNIFEENLRKSTMMAAKAGVLLGFETMETEFMNTVKKAMKYVDIMNSSYLGIYPDIGNVVNACNTYGTNYLEDLESGRGHIVAMHLKETLPGIFREVTYGTGHVDFETTICKAWSLGVRKYVTEFWYTGNLNWEEDLILARDMMSAILDRQ